MFCFQSVIFHVEEHPDFPWFHQCVTFNFFPSTSHEVAYNLFNMAAMYIAPLIVIIVTYLLIFYRIYLRSKAAKRKYTQYIDDLNLMHYDVVLRKHFLKIVSNSETFDSEFHEEHVFYVI